MVREQLQWLWREPVVHTSVRGATLTVSGSCPDTGPVNRCKADIDLAIPFDADVVVQGDSGDISAERLAGHLKLTTDSGDVTRARPQRDLASPPPPTPATSTWPSPPSRCR